MKAKLLLVSLLTMSIFHANLVIGAIREYDLTLVNRRLVFVIKAHRG